MIQITNSFFKDPYSVRNKAISLLESDSYTADNWPGKRALVPDNITSQLLSKVESITNEKLEVIQSTFQVVDQSFMEGIVHTDTHAKYTCVIFLNFEAPSNTGTEIYSDRFGNIMDGRGYIMDDYEDNKRKFYQSNRTSVDKFIFNRILNKVNPLFKDPCVVPNKFNRGVIFDSLLVHRAQNFFGKNISDSRFTLASFLKESMI
tara:strand:+ start:155 stop:766 length:612 start_codon:yes stop_codon:yes gene_type:complete